MRSEYSELVAMHTELAQKYVTCVVKHVHMSFHNKLIRLE